MGMWIFHIILNPDKSLLIMFHILLCHVVWGAGLGLTNSVLPCLGLGP